ERLHRWAAAWYTANEMPEKAINHTLAAGDMTQAADLIEQATVEMLRIRGGASTFLTWLAALPDEIILARPQLCLSQAWASAFTGQWENLAERLDYIEANLIDESDPGRAARIKGELATLRAELAIFNDSIDTALTLTEQALRYLPSDNTRLLTVANQIQGYCYRLNGEISKAYRALDEAYRLSRQAGVLATTSFTLQDLAEVYLINGRLHQAEQTFRQALELPAEANIWPFPPACGAFVGLGNLFYERNDLKAARQYLRKGVDLGDQGGYVGYSRRALLSLARLEQSQGHTDAAQAYFRKAENLVNQRWLIWAKDQVTTFQTRLWLWQGNIKAAGRWADAYQDQADKASPMPAYQRHTNRVTLARVRLAQGQPILDDIDRLLSTARAADWINSVIELLILKAIACDQAGQPAEAVDGLQSALIMAEPEGYIRTFVDEGGPLVKLLRLVDSSRVSTAYLGQIQAAFMPAVNERTVTAQSLIEPLTKRELEVLNLMAEGLSNQEIADQLILALGTVAKYSNNIFTKMNVRNRTQAISEAKRLGLI
ncbi:MAG: LuxR C-terminal-related transcriptional regulator, partial [Anaerolineae bacterium]|nr:LuxR C-terminal-related transcriptional regulator [Anaerolineae bacterium]